MGLKIENINNKFDEEKATLAGGLSISGDLGAQNLSVSGNISSNGNLAVKGSLDVDGVTTLNANVRIPKSRLGVGTTDPKGMIDARLDASGKLGGVLAISNFAGGYRSRGCH